MRGIRHPQAVRNDGPSSALKPQPFHKEAVMGFGRGALLWILGVPLPIIILLALFMR
jgi:hypothetical protein